jgi:hypothetical protein
MHSAQRASSSRVSQLLAVLSLVILSACASGARNTFVPPSRPAQFSLAGIPWGISADSVKALIEPRGYNFNRIDEDGDLWFDGVLNRVPTRIFAFMADQKLVKLRMLQITPDSAALPTYATTRAELVREYGAPKETIEEYAAPYKKGDKKQLSAILAGKATIKTEWLPAAGSRMVYVAAEVTEKAVVTVDYEGRSWERESVRRRQKQ